MPGPLPDTFSTCLAEPLLCSTWWRGGRWWRWEVMCNILLFLSSTILASSSCHLQSYLLYLLALAPSLNLCRILYRATRASTSFLSTNSRYLYYLKCISRLRDFLCWKHSASSLSRLDSHRRRWYLSLFRRSHTHISTIKLRHSFSPIHACWRISCCMAYLTSDNNRCVRHTSTAFNGERVFSCCYISCLRPSPCSPPGHIPPHLFC